MASCALLPWGYTCHQHPISHLDPQVIAEKLLDFLRTASDDGQKAEVAKRIGELAERFAPDTQWFIDTMNQASSSPLLLALTSMARYVGVE